MVDRTMVLCVAGKSDGLWLEYRGATIDRAAPVIQPLPTGLDWPKEALVMEVAPREIYRHATLTMQRSDGRVEAFDFYLIDGLHRDDVFAILVRGYRREKF